MVSAGGSYDVVILGSGIAGLGSASLGSRGIGGSPNAWARSAAKIG
jgi:hypothetical protein